MTEKAKVTLRINASETLMWYLFDTMHGKAIQKGTGSKQFSLEPGLYEILVLHADGSRTTNVYRIREEQTLSLC
jgi:hypothetical protein